MAFPLADTSHMRAVAHHLRAAATDIHVQQRQLRHALEHLQWHSIAASVFYTVADTVLGALHTAGRRLDTAADSLDQHAHRVDQEVAAAKHIASAVAHGAAAVEHGAQAIGHTTASLAHAIGF